MAVAVWFLVAAITFSYASAQCNDGDIILQGSKYPFQGNVMMCLHGLFGYICHDWFDANEAQVICRQLGYDETYSYYRTSSYYGWGNGTIHWNYLTCEGDEEKLIDCTSLYGLGTHYCDYSRIAGVYCAAGGDYECTDGDIRLAYHYNGNSYGRSEGRVEVCYDEEWGTVCHNSFDWPDAAVTCKRLGYSDTNPSWYYWAYFGQGIGDVLLENLYCNGNENSLLSCNSNGIGNSNCGHNQDVGVRCFGNTGDSCSHGSVRIWNGDSGLPDHEGILQYCVGSTWYSVCSYSYYYCDTARIACQQLGYPGAVVSRWNGGFYYGYYHANYIYYHGCYSWHTTLSSCYLYYGGYWWSHYCGDYWEALGIECFDPSSGAGSCTDGDIRLAGGEAENEGRVEYCYSGSWSPVCSLDAHTASLMCKKLGYTDYTWGAYYDDNRFGLSGINSLLNYIYCPSVFTDLDDCSVYTKSSGGCYISISPCADDYGLRCFNPGVCDDGDVRLVDGVIEQEGRPEVCVNGVWGAICQYSWNSVDAYVFCNQLGHDGPYPNLYYYSTFGESDYPIVWSYLSCNGWEHTVFDCNKNVYPYAYCTVTGSISGVLCKDGCENGDVRLLGGGFENEGTVEVCLDNLWGLVSDEGWTDADARVVCNQLGYTGGIAMAVLGSQYGKPNKTIQMKDVSCHGDEHNLYECTYFGYGWYWGKQALPDHSVAGVDCIYDIPTEPPCIAKPKNAGESAPSCSNEGSVRLVDQNGQVSTSEGRVEYCLNGRYTPLCNADAMVGSVICKSMGYTQYSWAAVVDDGSYGVLTNYSLVENFTCTGQENSLDGCMMYEPSSDCIPWCPYNNMGLRCFNPGSCTEGSVRLVDGIIENEGRVEFCVNGVWGSVCDDGWDKTDAHVTCTQLGHPELEPVVISGSYFGAGQYPVIYSNSACGGWETSFSDCSKDSYGDFSCPSSKVAGVLCGYDCQNGDVQLVGGDSEREGTVQVCFDNLWGLISESGWNQKDAEVVCRQLGFNPEGSMAYGDSTYGRPSLTVHLKDVLCQGEETSVSGCIAQVLSLTDGRVSTDDVAGVKCSHPTGCEVPSQEGGDGCNDGELRLTGTQTSSKAEGYLEYCYYGKWSSFCSLDSAEALVACRQLGYLEFGYVGIFDDGRFGTSDVGNMSYFEKFDCSSLVTPTDLTQCQIIDDCKSSCPYQIGITCYESSNCITGDVRLVDGKIDQEGRVEACAGGVWGPVCGKGFDEADAYVVCKELGYGTVYPTVFTDSSFGDGDGPVVYSQLDCRGYENTIVQCDKQEFGSFECARDNIAGLTCQDNCRDGQVRLVGGSIDQEGTVEVCFSSLWGLVVADDYWDDLDAQVVCNELNFTDGYIAVGDSQFGKPNKTVFMSEVMCNGTERTLLECDAEKLAADSGKGLHGVIEAAGVRCVAVEVGAGGLTGSAKSGVTAGAVIVGILVGISLAVIIAMGVYIFVTRRAGKKSISHRPTGPTRDIGIANPIALPDTGEHYDQSYTEKELLATMTQ